MQLSKQFANQFELVLRKGVQNTDTQRGELTITIGRLTLEVMGNFEAWAQDEVMRRATRLASQVPEDGRAFAINSAVSILSKEASWGEPVCDSLLRSPKGLAKLLHLLMPPDQRQAIRIEDLLSRIDIMEKPNIEAMLFRASGVEPDSPEAQPNPPEAARVPPTGGSSSTTSVIASSGTLQPLAGSPSAT